ncbi:kinase-like protein [Gigaspora margarita]|uniref:Kinase-like protein n=1 Tax=Gigaspora margarita TaxID=4874 RepID=A0A8H4AML1_GIGMA|nr:kinase-like protein [Gigaspora margarita]
MSFSHINSTEPFDSYIQPISIQNLHSDDILIQELNTLCLTFGSSRLSEESLPQPLTLQSFSEFSSDISNDISNDTSLEPLYALKSSYFPLKNTKMNIKFKRSCHDTSVDKCNEEDYKELFNFYDYNDFTIPEEIGRGVFSNVYKSVWKNCKLTVALKCLKFNTESEKNIIFKKIKHLQQVGFHPNIARIYGMVKGDQSCEDYYMAMQFANNGNLREYLNVNFPRLQWTDKLRIAKNITCGLKFLHKYSIVHGNIHAMNILVHEGKPMIADFGCLELLTERKMMITDFGLSKTLTSDTSSTHLIGTIPYIEPERLTNHSYKCDEKSDIYSLGVILWEISSGKRPFEFVQEREIISYILNGVRETPVKDTQTEYVEIYKSCWNQDPTIRPDASFVLDRLEKATQHHHLTQEHNLIKCKKMDPDLCIGQSIDSASSITVA